MKVFNVPITYRSPLIASIKNRRKEEDKMKKDFSPTHLDLGALQLFLARHFGFCYGVENAIEISFRTIDENPGKQIFLLSEMIHNPTVNADLRQRGVRFLQDTQGKTLIPFDELGSDDIVIIPAFGTTLDIERQLQAIGIQTEKYNTTCPFVEKVWNRSAQIAAKQYTVVIHGKPGHEETRATFSHASSNAPSIVIRDMAEARELAGFIVAAATAASGVVATAASGVSPSPAAAGEPSGSPSLASTFASRFGGRYSPGFDMYKDLGRIGVVNQTTMLASDTQAIADFLKQTMIETYGLSDDKVEERFADTRDTLCYATLDNQTAVMGMLDTTADLAIVVGGYNSSNTSHLVELCEERLPTYLIVGEENILSTQDILHYDIHQKREKQTTSWLPGKYPARILLTSGASCPDALIEGVIRRLATLFDAEETLAALLTSS